MTLPFDYRTTQVQAALAPLDRYARQLESAWGPGRLETLVDPDLARRFAAAREDLDAAIGRNDPEEVAHYASALLRGWQAVEVAARAQGHAPAALERVWCVTGDEGRRWVLVQDESDVGAAQAVYPGADIWSVREIVRVLASRDLDTVMAVKRAMPGATVTKVTVPGAAVAPVDWAVGDPVDDIGREA